MRLGGFGRGGVCICVPAREGQTQDTAMHKNKNDGSKYLFVRDGSPGTGTPATTSILLLRPGYAERLREYNLGGGFCQFHWYRIIAPHCPPRVLAVESGKIVPQFLL